MALLDEIEFARLQAQREGFANLEAALLELRNRLSVHEKKVDQQPQAASEIGR